MRERIAFKARVDSILAGIDPAVLSYDESEFWMIRRPYEYIESYALRNGMLNTALALPLARGIHDGVHRKSSIMKNGVKFRLPYVIHCLLVCRMLLDLHVQLPKEDEDIMLAAALCHDMIEDIPFPDGGKEMYTVYHLDPAVYETVRLVSKRRDFTADEELQFFRDIAHNRLALLVKLSDRSHNVEDLYNMSVWKVHEYIGETRKYFMPMCSYGLKTYPELVQTIEILHDKIISLTHVSEVLVDRFDAREKELSAKLETLQKENEALRKTYEELWVQESNANE